MLVEVCLSDITSAVNAARGGATSIELCVDRAAAGGVTPSKGLIEKTVQRVTAINSDVVVNVLIRPRDGDFVYSDDEFDIMLADIVTAKEAGAHGVVVGVLTKDGFIDKERMLQVRSTATPLSLTFHRAFDVINLSESTVEDALQHILDIGCDRLLTSGMAHKAFTEEGMKCLKKLTQYAKDVAPGFIVIAASGINADNCAQVLAATGVHGVHAGGSVTDGISTPDMTPAENGVVSDFNTRQVVSTTRVQELVLSCTSISDVI